MNALVLTVLAASRVLTLNEAIETARTHQPQLREAAANTRAADARVVAARAPLLPQVNASLRYNLSTANVVPQPGTNTAAVSGGPIGEADGGVARSDKFGNFTNGNLTVSQLVWDFGQTWNRLQASEHSASATRLDEQARVNSVLFAVRSAFFSALAAKQLLVVAKETLANQERHWEQVKGFVEVGTRPAIDLAQARTDRANARVQLISAQNGYASARAALNQAMGVEGRVDFDVADDRLEHVTEEDQALDQVIEVVLKNRPEIEALNARIRAQQELIAAARGAYGPSISVSSGVTGGSRDVRLTGNINLIGVSMSWNLFGGMGDWARVREAEAVMSALTAQLETLRLQVRLDIEQAQLAVHGAAESLLAAEEALQAAQDRLRLAEGRYETGVGNIIELGDAQLALTNAAAQKVRAEFDLSAARAQLMRTLGTP